MLYSTRIPQWAHAPFVALGALLALFGALSGARESGQGSPTRGIVLFLLGVALCAWASWVVSRPNFYRLSRGTVVSLRSTPAHTGLDFLPSSAPDSPSALIPVKRSFPEVWVVTIEDVYGHRLTLHVPERVFDVLHLGSVLDLRSTPHSFPPSF